ncbi:MAG: exodeoxyribonuclease V subunit gamma [Myxococcota bacterium]
MLRLTYGQDWGHLVDAWWPSLAQVDPFEPVDILLPQASAGRWLRLWVAERRGMASHWRTRTLDAWAKETVPELLTRARLRDHFVESMARGEGPDPVQRWLDSARTELDRQRRWVQLGARLADGLIDVWSELSAPELTPELSRWVGEVLEAGGRWTLSQALERGAFRSGAGAGPLHVLDAIPPRRGWAAAIAQAAQLRPVHVLASNPCVEFWEDLPSARRGPSSVQGELALEGPEENPILVAWGQHGRPLVRDLDFASAGDFEPCFRLPDSEGALHQVQKEVLARRASKPRPSDSSLQLSVFPSQDEEVRWVAEEIRQRLAEGRESFELGVALAGDDGAFREGLEGALQGVPIHHLDRRVLDRSAVFDAARRLWSLTTTAIGAELQDLLAHPNFEVPLDERERELAAGWIESAGLLEGLEGPLGWGAGLGRLARGLLADGTERGQPVPTTEPDGVARFIGFLRRLGRALPSARRRADRRSWMIHFHGLATHFIKVHDEGDERELGLLLGLVSERPDPGAPVWSHDMAWNLVEEEMSTLRRPEGPSAGVAVGRLQTMARRPARFCWVVQLDDRHFPRRNRPRPLGLPSRDLGDEDRFSLLLRLMNTRDALSLSWAGGPDGERGSAAVAELGGPEARTPSPPERVPPLRTPSIPESSPAPVRSLRPRDLVDFLLDPFEAWLRVLHGPPRRPSTRLQAALDLDLSQQRLQLERMLAELWPDDAPRAFALEQLSPSELPPSPLAEASRDRLTDTLKAWQDHLHAEGLPLGRLQRRATPNYDFEDFELVSSPIWVVEEARWCRVTAAAGRASWDRSRAETFVHHALANATSERSTLHLAVDEDGVRRLELAPWSPDEAQAWLKSLGRELTREAQAFHLPMDSAWALWEARSQPEEERRRLWSRLRLRSDPRPGLVLPSLEEAEARVRRRLGEVAERCL